MCQLALKALIATLGVIVSTIALFIVLSVFSGLKDFSLSFIRTADPDLKISAVEGKSFLFDEKMEKLLVSEKISAYAAFYSSDQQQEQLQQWLYQQDDEARLFSRQQLIDQSMLIFSRTFTTTDTLNLVTMLVAALSFFVSISLLVLDIRPQLLLLRSVGVHSRAIKASLFLQYGLIAISCAILALPFALLLAWLLVNKVNRFAFDWTYPLQLDPIVVLQSLSVGLGLMLLLLLLPLGKLQAKFSAQQGAE